MTWADRRRAYGRLHYTAKERAAYKLAVKLAGYGEASLSPAMFWHPDPEIAAMLRPLVEELLAKKKGTRRAAPDARRMGHLT